MSHSLGLAIEGLVAVLLVLTIGYCRLLNTRLKRLKADEQSLKATIGELITATEIAERAIGGLKHTVREVNEDLGSQIETATDLAQKLSKQLLQGDVVLQRIARIAVAARPAEPEPPRISAAQSIAAAAQAFSDRRRGNGLAA
jgi:hypothetical protein